MLGNCWCYVVDFIVLYDVFFCVGGVVVGWVDMVLCIYVYDIIVDYIWIWCVDYGEGVGWVSNLLVYGFVVDGEDVIIYGFFVEYF